MVNSPDAPGGCECIPGPSYSVKARAAKEYRKFKQPFLPPACIAVSALMSAHPAALSPWRASLGAAGPLHHGDQPCRRALDQRPIRI